MNRPILILGLALMLAACSNAREGDSLYRALGETAGIQRMTTAILDRVYADERIVDLFAETDRPDLERLIVEQICAEAGGPCVYSGRSMEESHSGLGINHKEFDAFVEDFILGMEDTGVSYRNQNRLLKIFAPMRRDVIDK